MRRSLAFLLLTIAAATANAAIQFSPELPIADPYPAASRANPRPYAVATDGADFLVVWIDTGGLKTTIVAANGEVPHEPWSAAIAPDAVSAFQEISAVWTGSVYLVTWYGGEYQTSMYAATFASDGTVVRAPYRAVDKAATISGALAHAGHRSLQIYLRRDPDDFRGALFDDDGSLVAADLRMPAIAWPGSYADLVRVASDASEFVLVWRTPGYVSLSASTMPPHLQQRFDTFHLQRIRDDGTLDGEPLTIGPVENSQSLGIAAGSGKLAIVTTELQLIVPGQSRPMVDRWIVDLQANTITALPKIESQGGDSVIWTGTGFVAYGERYSYGSTGIVTIAFAGTAEDTPPIPRTVPTNGPPFAPYLSASATTVFGAWTQSTGSTGAIYGAFLDRTATTYEKPPFLVSISWSRQFEPAIATSGSESLVAWVDETSGVPQGGLVAARVAMNGRAIDRVPISLASATIRGRPVVTFNGRIYVVVWTEAGDQSDVVRMRTVSPDGSLGPVIDIGIGWRVTAASNSAMTLVAFTEVPSGNVVAYRFGPNTERLDAQPLILGSGWSPSAATNGTDFFVAWNEGSDYWQWPPPDYIDVFGAHVGANGAVDAAPVPIATGPSNQILGAVASDGSDYVVFYSLYNPGGGIAAKRVLRDGGLIDTTPAESGPIVFGDVDAVAGARYALAVARDETGFWLAWPSDQSSNGRIILMHTDANGAAGEPMEIVRYDGWEITARVALAKPDHGSLQIAYARPVKQGKYAGTTQVFLRFAGEPANRRRAAGH